MNTSEHELVTISSDRMRKLRLGTLLLLIVIPLTVFGPSIYWGFTDFDDGRNIYENPHVASLSPAHLKWMFTNVDYARRYLPLGWMAYAVDQQFFGLHPFTYHLGNVLLHALNTVLAYALIRRLLEAGLGSSRFASRPVAGVIGPALVALLWSVNPLRVESVAWSCGRIYLVATTFFLGALLAYLRGAREEAAGGSSVRWRWTATALYLASLLTYPLMVFGAWAFLLLEVFPLRRFNAARPWEATRRVWLGLAPLGVIAGLMFSLTLWCNFFARENAMVIKAMPNYGTAAHKVMQSFYVWGYYVWKAWLPLDLAPHSPTLLSFNPWAFPFLASLTGVAGLTIWLWRRRSAWPAVWVAWLAHLILLVPMLGLTENRYFAADRYHYIIGIIPVALIAGALWKYWEHRLIRPMLLGGVALMVVFAGLSRSQLSAWQNAVTLRECDAVRAEKSFYLPWARTLLSAAYYRAGSNDLAIAAAQSALQLNPRMTPAIETLGDVAQAQDRLEDALKYYDEALRMDPQALSTHVNRGVVLGKQGRLNEAANAFRTVLESVPDHAGARQNLAFALEMLGRTNDARLVMSGQLPLEAAAGK